jgi:hypothetical protein
MLKIGVNNQKTFISNTNLAKISTATLPKIANMKYQTSLSDFLEKRNFLNLLIRVASGNPDFMKVSKLSSLLQATQSLKSSFSKLSLKDWKSK